MRGLVLVSGLAIGLFMGACRNGVDKYIPSGGVSYRNETLVNERLHLPDSSIAVITPATTIWLASGFARDNRQVSLDGEAWFEIAQRPLEAVAGQSPGAFELHTRDLLIEVLRPGRFHAEAFRSKPGEEIDLLDGGLRASKSYHSDTDNEAEVFGPGEMVMINRDIDLMEKEKLNASEMEKLKRAW